MSNEVATIEAAEKQAAAMNMIKAVADEGVATINGRDYEIKKFNHVDRCTVFAFYSRISPKVQAGDFSFLTDPEFAKVMKIIEDRVTFDDMQISKMKNHWDEYPEDYLQFISTMLAVVSYPFMRAAVGG